MFTHRVAGSTALILILLGTFNAMASPVRADEVKPVEEKESFLTALRQGSLDLQLRYRFEAVDEERFGDDAEASTLRTAFSYRSGEWRGWSLRLQAENVSAVFDDDGYNNAGAGSLSNGVRGVPVVADPELTELNQAAIRYRDDLWSVVLGRQEVNLGDQRFVGAVGWRQHHQTFDAARVRMKPAPQLTVDYTFVDRVHRIFGDDLGMTGHLLYMPMELIGGQKVTVYGFSLDYDAPSPFSTFTYGAEYTARLPLSDRFALKLELEAAQQDDTGGNPLPVDTQYYLASVGGDWGTTAFDVTWEVLGERGDGARPFSTPLATLHKFNGWADKFLQTPSAGLETLYLRWRGKLGDDWKYLLSYQGFSSDAFGFDFGTEIDAELVYRAPWKQAFGLKYADYQADEFATDTRKVMLWSSFKI